MSLQEEIQQLHQLLDALITRPRLEEAIRLQQKQTEQAIQDLINRDLPKLPKAPTAPKKPDSPPKKPPEPAKPHMITIEEKFGRSKPKVNILIPWMFWGMMRKKELKQWQTEVDAENNKRTALYEQACKNHKEQIKAYDYQCMIYREKMEEYEKQMALHKAELEAFKPVRDEHKKAVEQKRLDNEKKFATQIAQENAKVTALQQQLATVNAVIQTSNVVADQDKNRELVQFVLGKLESRRADSVMAALNLYDEDRRKTMEFETKLKIDQMNRQFEAEQRRWEAQERSRREAQQQFEQWSHNREMQNLERERLSEARRASDELERIRKATESD